MSLEANKAAARAFFEAFSADGDVSVLDRVVAPTYKGRRWQPGQPTGPDLVRQNVNAYRTGFPDVRIIIHDLIAEGDKVVVDYSFTGTHQGEFASVPGTGKRVEVTGIDIVRLVDGKIVELKAVMDRLGMLQQFGVIPSSVGAR
ncbi:MAG: ester cyclase [Chloroflexi bacterium]|nr:ester cyclase [Chloroflexota bacterium]